MASVLTMSAPVSGGYSPNYATSIQDQHERAEAQSTYGSSMVLVF